MVLPLASRIECNGDRATTHQKTSLDPVELAADDAHRRALAEGAQARRAMPALSPMSTAPETTTCSVSPPPWV